jgi:hypothetical protein
MFHLLVPNNHLADSQSNIHFSTSSRQFTHQPTTEFRLAPDFDRYKIAIPVPRARAPNFSTTNPELGKRGPISPLQDYGVNKQLKSGSSELSERFLQQIMQNLKIQPLNFENFQNTQIKSDCVSKIQIQLKNHENQTQKKLECVSNLIQKQENSIHTQDTKKKVSSIEFEEEDEDASFSIQNLPCKLTVRRRNNMLAVLQEFKETREKDLQKLLAQHDTNKSQHLRREIIQLLKKSSLQNKEGSELVSRFQEIISSISGSAAKSEKIENSKSKLSN